MCWGLKVFIRVFGNLAGRFCRETFDSIYSIGSFCKCNRNGEKSEQKTGELFISFDLI